MKNSKWFVLAGFFAVVLACSLTGCADTGDDPCDPETGEECEDGRDERKPPRDGGFLPYKPGLPVDVEVIEQAQVHAYPRMVDVAIAPIQGWDLGGYSNWMQHLANGEYYKARLDVYRNLTAGTTCTKSSTLHYQISCRDPATFRKTTYNCPTVYLTHVVAWAPAGSGVARPGQVPGFRTEPGIGFPGTYVQQEGNRLHCMSPYGLGKRFRLVRL